MDAATKNKLELVRRKITALNNSNFKVQNQNKSCSPVRNSNFGRKDNSYSFTNDNGIIISTTKQRKFLEIFEPIYQIF